jgi:caa(3)-type oxidase subunit IV
MAHEPAHAALDNLDPHHELHGGHVIIAPRTLVAVLAALLVLTVMTVAASRAEVWVAETFKVVVPQWINVGGVLLIAVVKSSLVAMYFMQLRYDSILNTIIFLFCIFALGLFLFFSMLDLGERATNYPWKSGEIQRGGMGINTFPGDLDRAKAGDSWPMRVNTDNKPITVWAASKRLEQIAATGVADPKAQFEFEQQLFARHGHAEPEGPELSSPNRSVPRTGATPDLFKPAGEHAPEAGGHGGH